MRSRLTRRPGPEAIQLLALALIALVWPLLVSCVENRPASADPTANPTPEPRFLLSAKPEQYFDLFPFHLDERVPRVSLPYLWPTPADGPRYQEVVAKLRAEGIEALSNEDRQLLLVVTWYARLMQTDTLKYRVEERDNSGGRVSLEEAEERYEFLGSGDSRAPRLTASRETWLQMPKSEGLQADESIYSYQYLDDSWQEALITVWGHSGPSWLCVRQRVSGLSQSGLVMPKTFASATPIGTEEVNGRLAFKLEAPEDHSGLPAYPVYLWLDAETLLPIQEEYDIGQGETKLTSIIEINEQVDVTPPDVNVPCQEHDFGEGGE